MIKEDKFVVKTWKGNQTGTVIVSIPKEIVQSYRIETSSHMILEKKLDGILLKKLEI